jgi:hypothetical protein
LLGAFAAAPPPGLDGQIARWVHALDDDRFQVRESAHAHLLRAGKAAIPALADAAAASSSLEVTMRTVRILRKLLASTDQSTSETARAALVKLASSRHAQAAARARFALLSHLASIVVALEKGGGRATVRDEKIVTVDLDGARKLAPLLPLLKHLPDLEYVSAGNRQMDDKALAQLKNLPRLKKLNLYQSNIGDQGLKHLARFPRLREVPMGETKVTDEGLKHLANLTHLEYVGLRGNQVTNAGLIHLRKLTNLTGLYLGETKVTDAGLVHLKDMKKMGYLLLHNLAITDAGLEHLKGLTSLQTLDLSRTKVTKAGIDRLRKALPKLNVVWNER